MHLTVLPALGPALVLVVLLFHSWTSTSCTFKTVAAGPDWELSRCTQRLLGHSAGPLLLRLNAQRGWLQWWRSAGPPRWVLVDTPAASDGPWGSYASGMVHALQRKLRAGGHGGGELDLLVLTHGRLVGAVPHLLARYPDMRVALHATEAGRLMAPPPAEAGGTHRLEAALAGNASVPRPSRLLVALGLQPTLQAGIPANRTVLLEGEEGDLGQSLRAAAASKKALRWFPRNVLRFVHVPGYSEGLIVLLHQPSKLLLASDAVAPARTWLLGGLPRTFHAPPPGATTRPELAAPSAKRVIEQENFAFMLPFRGGNFSKAQAMQAVAGWPGEPPAAPAGDEAEAPAAAEARAAPEVQPELEMEEAGKGQGNSASHNTAAAGLGISPSAGAGVETAGLDAAAGRPHGIEL
eukprot:scaffold1.g5693.t1